MNHEEAAKRLHHLSLRYVGALVELVTGKKQGLLSTNYEGLRECRDLIDLILLTRAEINGIINILVKKKIVTVNEVEKEFTEQYQWFTEQKAHFLNVQVTNYGLVINL